MAHREGLEFDGLGARPVPTLDQLLEEVKVRETPAFYEEHPYGRAPGFTVRPVRVPEDITDDELAEAQQKIVRSMTINEIGSAVVAKMTEVAREAEREAGIPGHLSAYSRDSSPLTDPPRWSRGRPRDLTGVEVRLGPSAAMRREYNG